jgi:ATP-dependent DNA helicase RecG
MSKPLKQLNQVGAKTESVLKRLGLKTILDLVLYLPSRYEKYSSYSQISEAPINQNIVIEAEVELIRSKRSFRKRMNITEALISDGSSSLEVIWFNQVFISKNIKRGDKVSLAGKIKYNQGRLMMVSPSYEKVSDYRKNIHTNTIVPLYRSSAGLSQKQLRYFISQALEIENDLPEYLPEETLKRQNLLNINEALRKIHFPENEKEISEASYRFKFSELFVFQIQSYFLKEKLKEKRAFPLETKIEDIKKFISSLPFTLSDDQKKASWAILKDISQDRPMNRLLQGDVGSGKTIVALIAILNCLINKKKSALMAPTEILAKQHYNTIIEFLSNHNFKIANISSKSRQANFPIGEKKKEQIDNIKKEADLIIGTHALIQKNISFEELALIVIDEQHRFGVNQRQEIITKNISEQKISPHFLSMTATPIPRSLALTSFQDLNFSIISEKPKNRAETITKIVGSDKREKMYDFLKKEISAGQQIFIVCPLIDPSDKSGSKSVKEEYEKLKREVFFDIEVGMLHGKMKSEEKEKTMKDLVGNKIKVLISTSVIEVGIDLPNATVMLIEGAENFGLAQLHQFRGRVGRGEKKSYCFLALSEDSPENERLEALQKHNDGLALAKIDLKNRGSGSFYGTAQSGLADFKFASLLDLETIEKTKEEIEILSKKSPKLEKYPDLLKKTKKKTEEAHLE